MEHVDKQQYDVYMDRLNLSLDQVTARQSRLARIRDVATKVIAASLALLVVPVVVGTAFGINEAIAFKIVISVMMGIVVVALAVSAVAETKYYRKSDRVRELRWTVAGWKGLGQRFEPDYRAHMTEERIASWERFFHDRVRYTSEVLARLDLPSLNNVPKETP